MAHEITRTAEIKISVTPQELGKIFCSYTSDDMAEFFNFIGEETAKQHWRNGFSAQVGFIARNSILTNAGKRVMHLLGSFFTDQL